MIEVGRWGILRMFFVDFFCGRESVGHFFAYVAHFEFLRDVWIRTQRAAVASRRATSPATHLSIAYIWSSHQQG